MAKALKKGMSNRNDICRSCRHSFHRWCQQKMVCLVSRVFVWLRFV